MADWRIPENKITIELGGKEIEIKADRVEMNFLGARPFSQTAVGRSTRKQVTRVYAWLLKNPRWLADDAEIEINDFVRAISAEKVHRLVEKMAGHLYGVETKKLPLEEFKPKTQDSRIASRKEFIRVTMKRKLD